MTRQLLLGCSAFCLLTPLTAPDARAVMPKQLPK
jgi:hypothetical protein